MGMQRTHVVFRAPVSSLRASYTLGKRVLRSHLAASAVPIALSFMLSRACTLLLCPCAMLFSSCTYFSWSKVMTCTSDKLVQMSIHLTVAMTSVNMFAIFFIWDQWLLALRMSCSMCLCQCTLSVCLRRTSTYPESQHLLPGVCRLTVVNSHFKHNAATPCQEGAVHLQTPASGLTVSDFQGWQSLAAR